MKKIILTISDSALMSEMSKWSYTTAEGLADDQAQLRHFLQGATDRGHDELLRAAADDAWSELLQVMSAYTVDGECPCPGCGEYRCGCADGQGTDTANRDALSDPPHLFTDYSVTLFFPDNTYPHIGDNVRRLAYRYVTLKLRAEWLRLTQRDPAGDEATAEQTIRRLKTEITTRTTRAKIKRYG